MALLMFLFMLPICLVYGQYCDYCNCSTTNVFYICDCTSTKKCPEEVNDTVLLPTHNMITSNINIERIEEFILYDISGSTILFSQKIENLNKTRIHSCNKIKIDKNTFRNIETLRILTIENNRKLEIYEDSFNYLSNLVYISLKNNSIPKIPNKLLKNLTKLKSINLAINEIEELNANSFTANIYLEEIYLNKNNITELSNASFNGLKFVTIIDLGDNKIQKLAEGTFSNLYNLKTVNLRNNKISTIHGSAFGYSSNLENIYLEENIIQNIDPYILSTLPRLKHIDMPTSSINCDCKIRSFHISYKKRGISGNVNCSSSTNKSNKKFSDLTIDDFVCVQEIECIYGENGHEVIISCKVYGFPKPNITWQLNGTDITNNASYGVRTMYINNDTFWTNLTVSRFSRTESIKIKAQHNDGVKESNYILKYIDTAEDQPSIDFSILWIIPCTLFFFLGLVVHKVAPFVRRMCVKRCSYNVQDDHDKPNDCSNNPLLKQVDPEKLEDVDDKSKDYSMNIMPEQADPESLKDVDDKSNDCSTNIMLEYADPELLKDRAPSTRINIDSDH